MKTIKNIFFVLLVLAQGACASTELGGLEKAKFELDKENYSAAISAATSSLSEDPTNVEAARLLASAYLGRSGIDYFNLAEGITDLQNNNDDSNLVQIAGVLPTTADMDDLRSAIETLETLSGIDSATITDENLKDAAFDLGIMMVIEHFAIGVYSSDYNTSFDVTGISDTDKSNVQTDLLNFDNRLIASGLASDEDFVSEIRQTFCILKDISGESGFTTSEYQAYVGCQLSDDPSSFDTASIDANIADCDAVNPDNQSTTVQSCYDDDTSL